MLGAELKHHLGYAPGEEKPAGQANHRNGTTPKTVLTDDGALPLEVPRDRAWHLRAAAGPQGSAPAPGLRCQGALALRARAHGAGDPGPPRRAVPARTCGSNRIGTGFAGISTRHGYPIPPVRR
jgi:hypothetical protein